MLGDLRQIGRQLRRRPAGAGLTVLLVGPAVGAATVGLSMYHTLVVRPLPFPEPDELVEIWESHALRPEAVDELPVGTALFADLQARTDLFAGVAAMLHHNAPYTGTTGSDRFRRAVSVTPNFFDVLGVSTAIGVGIRTGETADTAVLSHAFWQDEYGGADDVVGRTLRVSLRAQQELHTITGILPADLWLPPILLRSQDAMVEPQVFFNMPRSPHGAVIARMRSGVTIDRVRAELDRMTADIRASAQAGSYFETVALRAVPLSDLRDDVVGGPARYLASVTVLLLIAAGMTVTGLALVRLPSEKRRYALYAALGASRRQLVRQAGLRAALVSGAAVVLGGVLAYWGAGVLAATAPPGFARSADAGLGVSAVVLLAALWIGVALLLAAVPLAAAWGSGARPTLQPARGSSPRNSMAGAVITVELGVCIVLLVATGLALSRALVLGRVDTGYDADRVVTFDVTVPQFTYPSPADRERVWTALVDRLRAIPGVEAVGRGNAVPLDGFARDTAIIRLDLSHGVVTPDLRTVEAGWFDASGIEVLAGETFRATDYRTAAGLEPARHPVLINELLARQLFPGQASVIGERVVLGQGRMLPTLGQPGAAAPPTNNPMEIIGVVETTRNVGIDGEPVPQIYQAQGTFFSGYAFVLRTSDPDRVLAAVRPVVAEVDRDFLVEELSTLEDRIAQFAAPQRFYGRVVAVLAAGLLLLALLTLYAIVAAAVARRTREIGVRVALGAGPRDVWRWVLAQGVKPVATGVVLGVLAVWWLEPAWQRIEASAGVFAMLAAALAIVTAAALAAHVLPVRRALDVDPTTALRVE